jgi:DNA primase
MLYPQHVIDDLKNRADLVRIVQQFVPDLKKKGANWMACCPFHQEKTPSFSVNPAKGFYKCFGCGKGGTAFNFLMEIENISFPEAIKRVADISGYMLPEPIDDASYKRSKKRRDEKKLLAEQVIELNQVALDFWEKELKGSGAKAKAAREYLEKRGISEDIQKQFRIGFSPDSWDALLSVLRDFGADEKLIAQSGLVSVNEEKDRTYDRFRGRIMFPVLDVEGRPVAFGARGLTPEDQPKYLNSPETPAYVKGDHLYGLFQAKDAIRKKRFVILVEGYLDLIALFQHGIRNVAASLGTAFTDAQARLLHRFTERVVINYDGDDPGIKAARRAVEHLLPQNFDIKVLVLPDGKDPDDFVRAHGPERYSELRGKALPFLRFCLDAVSKGRDLNDAKQKAEAVEGILPVITPIRNTVRQRATFDQAMDHFGIDDDGIRRELWTTIHRGNQAITPNAKSDLIKTTGVREHVAELELLVLLASDSKVRDAVIPHIEPSDYVDLANSDIFEAFIAQHESGKPFTAEEIIQISEWDEPTVVKIRSIFAGQPLLKKDEDIIQHAIGRLIGIRDFAIFKRINEIARQTIIAQQTGDTKLLATLIMEKSKLHKLRRSLHQHAASL